MDLREIDMGDRELRRPMFLDYDSDKMPNNFILNTLSTHGARIFRADCDHKKTFIVNENNCACVDCLKKKYDNLIIGDPIEINRSFSYKLLKELGYVGIYRKDQRKE